MKKTIKQSHVTLARVKQNYQVTIPSELRKKFNVSEGDYIKIKIEPFKLVPSGQEYFHTKEWQKGEAEADKDIAEGRVVGPFNNVKDLIKELKS